MGKKRLVLTRKTLDQLRADVVPIFNQYFGNNSEKKKTVIKLTKKIQAPKLIKLSKPIREPVPEKKKKREPVPEKKKLNVKLRPILDFIPVSKESHATLVEISDALRSDPYITSSQRREKKQIFQQTTIRAKTIEQLHEKILEIHSDQRNAYKLNFRFGFVVQKNEKDPDTNEYIKYYIHFKPDSSSEFFNIGNKQTHLPSKLQVVTKRSDMENILSNFITLDNFEFLVNGHKLTPSGISLKAISDVVVEMSFLNQPMGDSTIVIPTKLMNMTSLITFSDIHHNLCFFACLAKCLNESLRRDRCQSEANKLYKSFYGVTDASYKKYLGIQYHELDLVEEHFDVSINSFQYISETDTFETVRTSKRKNSKKTLDLCQYLNHYMFISKRHLVVGYPCPDCKRYFSRLEDISRHRKSNQCMGSDSVTVEDVFDEESHPYRVSENILKNLLQLFNLDHEDFFVDPLAVFDFETNIDTSKYVKVSEKTEYKGQNTPISWSVKTNIPGMELKTMLLDECNMSPYDLVRCFADYIIEYSRKAREATNEKFKDLLHKIKYCKDNKYKSNRKDYLRQYYQSTKAVLLGYNSGGFDLNAIKDFGFFQHLSNHDFCGKLHKQNTDFFNDIIFHDGQSDDDNMSIASKVFTPFSIRDGNTYKVYSEGDLRILDQMMFMAAGTPLKKFIESYNTTAKIGKLAFPHSYFSFETDREKPFPPPHEEFFSDLKLKNITTEEYNTCVKVGKEYNCKTMRDFLKLYNEFDVVPFLEACLIYRDDIRARKHIDVFATCLGAPTLAIQSLLSSAFEEESYPEHEKSWNLTPNFDLNVSLQSIEKRALSHEAEDLKEKRETGFTPEHIIELFQNQGGFCYCCHARLSDETYSIDRIDNDLGHIDGNLKITCVHCNTSRGKCDIEVQRKKKCRGAFDRLKPQLWVMGEEDKEAFYLYKKKGITGGPSIVFHRYHKVDETKIQHISHNSETWSVDSEGKTVKVIISFDANSLYPWAYGFNDMPCGKVKVTKNPDQEKTIAGVLSGKIFGFVLCDLHVPLERYTHFGEFPPLFVNTPIEGVSKLTSVMKATEYLTCTELLKWYVQHGLVVTKIHELHEFQRGQPFRKFVEQTADERRKGGMFNELGKILLNSPFGKFGQNNDNHRSYFVTTDPKVASQRVNDVYFASGSEMIDDKENSLYEIFKQKKKTKQNMPMHGASMIYQLAKLQMLKFYYDCVDKFISRSDYQLMYMDTDSNWLAFSSEDPFENLIKPEMKEQWLREKNEWLVSDKYSEKTPGLFKEEYKARELVALSSKMYMAPPFDTPICDDLEDGNVVEIDSLFEECSDSKSGTKGIQQRNILDVDMFRQALFEDKIFNVDNSGMRTINGKNINYETTKKGVHSAYNKRTIADNKINTFPIEI